HNQAGTGHCRRANRCKGGGEYDGNLLCEIKINGVKLGEKNYCNRLIQTRPIHIHRSTDWQYEARYIPGYSQILFHTIHSNREGSCTGTGRKCQKLCGAYSFEEFAVCQRLNNGFSDKRIKNENHKE